MKNDLIYQSSEYDCGPTCMTNAIRFLFEREEIQPGILKQIWVMGNDTYCEKGHLGCRGTSKAAMRYMADWFNGYGKGCGFPIRAKFLDDQDAKIAPGTQTWQCLRRGGCAVMRCTAGGIPHYVLLTAILNEEEIALFDPYWEEPDFKAPGRRVVEGHPKAYNRAVRCPLLNLTDESDYAMGPLDKRENLLLWRGEQEEKP
ncbi:MAG: peptidase C39 [Clostridia bacterium]|nr:peptidase C39 [Clostridia bacterium]